MKKLYAILLSGVMTVSSIPFGGGDLVSYGAESNSLVREDSSSMKKSHEPTDAALKQAITTVKQKIKIPSSYSEFEYYFNDSNSYSDSYWNFTWKEPDGERSIRVRCDYDNHILYYRQYDYTEKDNNLPTYLKKELKDTAEAFIKKTAPEVSHSLSYDGADYEGIYSGNYVYQFVREENGILLPDNSVKVGVNSTTGKVSYMNITWLYDVTIPSSKAKLSKEEATKLIKEHMSMDLIYRSGYSLYGDESDTTKAFLVYQPSESYISIDANTGEVYLSREEWMDETGARDDIKEEATASDTAAAESLTEDEIAKIEELKNLISKEDALKKVTGNSYLYMDKSLSLKSANLNKLYSPKEESNYIWNFTFRDNTPVDYDDESDQYRAYAYAQVDAKTGAIVSFYASVPDFYNEEKGTWDTPKILFDQEESQKRLELFLKSQINQKFKNSTLVDSSDDYIAYYKKENIPVYGGYSYQYQRVNEGVVYPNNGIYGSVDGITGKIYSYRSSWTEDIKFESPKGAMTADEAMDHYLSKEGYNLYYQIYNIYQDSNDFSYDNVKYEVRLTYHPDITPSFISPFTGEQLTASGEVYSDQEPYSYVDIADTKENREILLLSDMNIGFEGEYFYPTKEITQGEFSELFDKIGYGNSSDETVVKKQKITREELAHTFILRLGLGKIASLSGIYQTDYADSNNIGKKYQGDVALVTGLGIMKAKNNNNFSPTSYVTRAEAVHLILQYINVQQSGIYE